jgi:hypothetical protein
MVHMVEHLPSKHKALSSNTSTKNNNKKSIVIARLLASKQNSSQKKKVGLSGKKRAQDLLSSVSSDSSLAKVGPGVGGEVNMVGMCSEAVLTLFCYCDKIPETTNV